MKLIKNDIVDDLLERVWLLWVYLTLCNFTIQYKQTKTNIRTYTRINASKCHYEVLLAQRFRIVGRGINNSKHRYVFIYIYILEGYTVYKIRRAMYIYIDYSYSCL